MKKNPSKIRITLDLSEPLYHRLERLERLIQAESKASLLRQALQLLEYVAERSLEGWTFRAVAPDGSTSETIVFVGVTHVVSDD